MLKSSKNQSLDRLAKIVEIEELSVRGKIIILMVLVDLMAIIVFVNLVSFVPHRLRIACMNSGGRFCRAVCHQFGKLGLHTRAGWFVVLLVNLLLLLHYESTRYVVWARVRILEHQIEVFLLFSVATRSS
jgi:hypothetical protein